MALVNCPDCGREISTSAKACPNCGRPMNKNVDGSVVTIQKTSKKIKAQGCLGAVIMILGFVCASASESVPAVGLIGSVLAFVGLIMMILSLIEKWWNHD